MVVEQATVTMDKGYAWVILFACSSIYVVMSGMAKAFGILYTELINEFDTGAGSTAWIGSVMMFLFFGLGPISNRLAERFTFRKVIMVGGVLTSLGHFLSAFVPRMEWMYLTIGVIAGSGCGFVFAPSTTIISFYFEKRRAMALGVVLAGAGLGSVVYPYFYRIILDSFGLRTSLIIVSGVLMYVPFVALLLREPAQLAKKTDDNLPDKFSKDKDQNQSITTNKPYYVDSCVPRAQTYSSEASRQHVILSRDGIRKIFDVNANREDTKTNSVETNSIMIMNEVV
ncbi:monocarboxylate transporter 3-like [Pecten maximus]|uniref:monocarboxylate transporter 3-like n=1 Tax=Pecten maximus TaxID=6579 RepID=UPI00145863E8|nr:monocarboxylate transporter 3-like [Pecten maximus]